MDLKQLLQDVHQGRMTPEKAEEILQKFPAADLGYAVIDHQRTLRKGFPEVIYCQGKTTDQVLGIATHMFEEAHTNVLATRATPDMAEALQKRFAETEWNPSARTLVLRRFPQENRGVGKILVATAGTSDLPVAEEAEVTARFLGHETLRLRDVGVAGLHRLLTRLEVIAAARVIIVVAGMEGALAGVIAGLTDKPVIAVPTSTGYGANFGGLAPLLAMLNACATGVAVVNIDNGFGAACMACSINRLGR
ncbi:MAG: nickel pincer cofactor biosynthesis protein LarB [Tannerellaceae bacterium]|jgi:NCAIR mutase (PurE)-related protein|nr:nickel pincer cofactor biosynthesis protein LarB [Tannerellaceae bacterium]